MKKNKKNKNDEIKNINYKLVATILGILLALVLLIFALFTIFYFKEKIPMFGSIFLIIIPTITLLFLFLLAKNMYKDMIRYENKYREIEKKSNNIEII